MYRIQRLPEILFTNIDMNNKNFYVFFWDGDEKKYAQVSSAEIAKEKVASAEAKGMGAFASGPIPCNKNQHGVFMVSCNGKTHDVFHSKNYDKIKKAFDSVFGLTVTEPGKKEMPVQIIKKKEEQKEQDALDWLDSI